MLKEIIFSKQTEEEKRNNVINYETRISMNRALVTRKITKVVLITFLMMYMLISLYPMVWSIVASMTDPNQIPRLGIIPILPDHIWTSYNYDNFFNIGNGAYFDTWIRNSLLYSTANATINMFFNFLAGYALARIKFGGKNAAIWYMLAATMIPVQATQIPQLIILIRLGLIGGFTPYPIFMLGILSTGMTSTVLIFMIRQFYINQSSSIEEAGTIDGLSRFKVFFMISLKTMLPLLATQWAMVFIGSWNNFLMFQLWSMGNPNFLNLVGGLVVASDISDSFDGTGLLLAGSTISVMPVLVVYMVSLRFQKKVMVDGEK